jgi:hypothetical protein
MAIRGQAHYDVTSTADSTSFLFNVLPTVTTAYTPGIYDYAIYVTNGTDRHILEKGTLKIIRDVTSTDVYSNQTWARRTLAAVEAVLEGRAKKGEDNYEIAGRKVSKIPVPELMQLRSSLRQEVKAEEAAESMARGEKPGNMIKFRF